MATEQSSDSVPAAGSASSRSRPLDWPQIAGQAEPVAQAIEAFVRQRQRRRRQIGALAAGVVMLLATGVAWRSEFFPRDGSERTAARATPAAASTVVSLPARQTLPDGSVVELKPGAEISVNFTAASAEPRRVVLKGGEAHFTVTKNPARPFIVEADGVEVRAVGTAFSVQRGGGEVAVLVTEGRVAVDKSPPVHATGEVAAANDAVTTAPAIAPPPLAFVDAGSRAVVSTGAAPAAADVREVSAAELSAKLAWRVPRLEFNATPIAEVVAMFNRHAAPQGAEPAAHLTLADSALATLPLSGVLRADNITVLLQIMESSYGIQAERRPAGEIVLRKAR